MAVLEEFKIPFYINADLDESGMVVDPDTIGFGLQDLNSIFKNDVFFVLCRFGHRNTLEHNTALLFKNDEIVAADTESPVGRTQNNRKKRSVL